MRFLTRFLLGSLLVGGGTWFVRSRRQDWRGAAVEHLLERPANDKRYAQLARDLQRAGERLRSRLDRRRGSEFNAQKLRHIIGVERWGQRRLRGALGAPATRETHHAYLPPGADWASLKRDFAQTRAESVALARELSESPPGTEWRAEHDTLGPLSARAWLRYLLLHADLEGRQLR